MSAKGFLKGWTVVWMMSILLDERVDEPVNAREEECINGCTGE